MFIYFYVQVELEDESDIEIAKILLNLYNEIKEEKDNLLNKLKRDENETSMKHSIDFPILGNQMLFSKKKILKKVMKKKKKIIMIIIKWKLMMMMMMVLQL